MSNDEHILSWMKLPRTGVLFSQKATELSARYLEKTYTLCIFIVTLIRQKSI